MVQQRGTVAAGVLLVLAITVRADESAAVRAIKEAGGYVTVDPQRPGKPVVEVQLGFRRVTDAGLKELKELKSLRYLHLGGAQFTDAGLKELKQLQSLEYLSLNNTKITDAGVKELQAALPRLEIAR